MKLSVIAARNVSRNKRRSILSATAVAVAAMTIVFAFSMIGGMKTDIRNNLWHFYSGQVRLRNVEYDRNEDLNPLAEGIENYEELTGAVAAQDYVQAVSPRITFGTGIYRNETAYKAMGVGVDFEREKSYYDLSSVLTEGELPAPGSSDVLLSEGLAEDMNISVGEKMTLLAQTRGRGSNAMTFTVSGIARFPVQALNKSYFLAPIDRVDRLLRMHGSITEILVMLDKGVSEKEAVQNLNALLTNEGRNGIEAKSWKSTGETYQLIQLAEVMYNFIALFFFILGSTVIINTTIMVIYERIREIGTISALGMQGSEIVRLFFLESMFIAVLGSLAGVLIGSAITYVTARTGIDMSTAMEGVSFEISPVLYPVLSFRSTVFVFIYSTAVASLVSLLPSKKAASIKPVEALRSV